jgi:hypothetical protein
MGSPAGQGAAEQASWVRFGSAGRIPAGGPPRESVPDEMASALVAHAADGRASPDVPPAPADALVGHADVKPVVISDRESVDRFRDRERLARHVVRPPCGPWPQRRRQERLHANAPAVGPRCGLLQDPPLVFQLGELAPRVRQLHPLIGTERGRPVGSLAALGGHPVAQRLVSTPSSPATSRMLRRLSSTSCAAPNRNCSGYLLRRTARGLAAALRRVRRCSADGAHTTLTARAEPRPA